MQFSAVTFVLAETIVGKMGAKVTHYRITCDFRDHAGGGNAKAEAIALDDGGLWTWKGNNGQTINQNVIGRNGKRGNGHAHGFVRRAQNINPVDLDRIDNTDCPADLRITNQFTINFFTQFRCKLFGIVQAPVPEFFRKNHCGGDNRTSQSTATSLVDAGDARDTSGAQLPFMTESTAPIHRSADYTDEEKRKLGKQEKEIEDSALSPLIIHHLPLIARHYSLTAVASLPLRVRR